MSLNAGKTVRELAVEVPNATRVFEKFGIDYCCGGKKPLEEACRAANLPVHDVIAALETAANHANRSGHDLPSGSLTELVDHIVKTHHKFTREEIDRLRKLLAKVCVVHGKNHPELFDIQSAFYDLAQELTLHLMKEENVLFPYIIRLEESALQNDPVLPPPFGSVQNPVRMMAQEHDNAGDALRRIRAASSNFSVPPEACVSYRALYEALAGFEADLHQHIHLENNVLFPRSIALEEKALALVR